METSSVGNLSEVPVTGAEEKVRTVLTHTFNFNNEEKEVSLTVTGEKRVWYIPNFRGYSIITYTPGSVTARTFLNNRCRASVTFKLKDGKVTFFVYTKTGKTKKVRSSYHASDDFITATRTALNGKKMRGGDRKHNSIPALEACLTHALCYLLVEQNPHRSVTLTEAPASMNLGNYRSLSGHVNPKKIQNFLMFPNLDKPNLALKGNRKLRILRENNLRSISRKLLGTTGAQTNTVVAQLLANPNGVGAGLISAVKTIRKLKWEHNKVLEIVQAPGFEAFFTDSEADTAALEGALRVLGPDKAIRLLSEKLDYNTSYYLKDAIRMHGSLVASGFPAEIPSELKNFRELHEFYSQISNRRTSNNFKLWSHPDLTEAFDGQPVYIYPESNVVEALLFGDSSDGVPVEEYTIQFPKDDMTLRCWGQELSICVGSYGHVVNSGRTIVFGLMKDEGIYACIDLDGNNFILRQANTNFDKRIPSRIISVLCDLLGIESTSYWSYDGDPNKRMNGHKPLRHRKWASMVDPARRMVPIIDETEEADKHQVMMKEALHSVIRQRREGRGGYNPYARYDSPIVSKPEPAKFNVVDLLKVVVSVYMPPSSYRKMETDRRTKAAKNAVQATRNNYPVEVDLADFM